METRREVAYALLRMTLGVMFLFYGIGKLLGGLENFSAGLVERFSTSPIPAGLVSVFGYVLPFVELLIGSLLILGLFSVVALILAGFLMIALTFGAVMEPNPSTVADNVMFAAVIFILLWLSDYNNYSLDHFRR